jgi:hypothetical protein
MVHNPALKKIGFAQQANLLFCLIIAKVNKDSFALQ